MEALDEIFKEREEKLADWEDASALCDRLGAPKGMTLAGRIAWLFTDKARKSA